MWVVSSHRIGSPMLEGEKPALPHQKGGFEQSHPASYSEVIRADAGLRRVSSDGHS
jgi:hypothetical protein